MKHKLKVTLHTKIKLSYSSGRKVVYRVSKNWVVEGRNPLGPRGGHCGNIVNGKLVAGEFETFDQALEFALIYAFLKGHHFVY